LCRQEIAHYNYQLQIRDSDSVRVLQLTSPEGTNRLTCAKSPPSTPR
jgi:hypothetical protein